MHPTISWCLVTVSALSICGLATAVPVECTERCKFGFDKDANGLEVCQCHDPCKDVVCKSDEVCYPQYYSCLRGFPCLPVGVCVPDSTEVPSIRYKRYIRRRQRGYPRPQTPPHNPRPSGPRWP